ncbi:prepilin-type N-terminal cleavage/methylation domain-containing protein [Azospirillum sp. ST 5-10]|uniref:prepilin-type N-terminal cleavage/methylation domain-containing protein n=1 Tax=unclassified Azospirillum TaxID=2630922 RepID=UPI003F4A8271
MSAERPAAGGFTLIEVVVALAVLALATAAVLPQFGGALRLGAAAADARTAELVARSVLARLVAEAGPGPATLDGTAGPDLAWRATLVPLAIPGVAADAPLVLRPLQATVTVGAPDGAPLARLATVVLGRPR